MDYHLLHFAPESPEEDKGTGLEEPLASVFKNPSCAFNNNNISIKFEKHQSNNEPGTQMKRLDSTNSEEDYVVMFLPGTTAHADGDTARKENIAGKMQMETLRVTCDSNTTE
uniref:Uncharacterized protein n=1 Tax=Cacopsylla melanoneura TaxID=428564 RepID=A0A8D8V420_9HEMI